MGAQMFGHARLATDSELPLSAAQLTLYADQKFYELQSAGTSLNLAGQNQPAKIALIATHADGKIDVTALMVEANLTGNGWSTTWYQSTGNITVDAAELALIANKLKTYTTELLAAWQQAVAGIAGNTITTRAQIDALSWPS